MNHRIYDFIRESADRLKNHTKFMEMLDPEKNHPGDIVLINNSFVFRDVKTTKSDKYLSFLINQSPAEPTLNVASGHRFNTDFKKIASNSSNMPDISSLEEAVNSQIEHLGYLVFLLIGEVQDNEVVEATLNNSAFRKVIWDPTISQDATVGEDQIVVKSTEDEEAVWKAVIKQYTATVTEVPDGLRDALGVALDKLQDQAVARVRIPQPGQDAAFGITDAVLEVLREQRGEYSRAVSTLNQNGTTSESALNDVLRIAYNFASDATGFCALSSLSAI